jgi:hypothetical protein
MKHPLRLSRIFGRTTLSSAETPVRQPKKPKEKAFTLPALEFGWGALGWRPYELHYTGLAAGDQLGGKPFRGLLDGGWRPWGPEERTTKL